MTFIPDYSLLVWSEISWPIALAFAWVAGEAGHRWLRIPRISCYGLVGFLMAVNQGGFLPDPSTSSVAVLADIALGLVLFELGYRINLGWLRANPWLLLTSALESCGTFVAVFCTARFFDMTVLPSLLLASLAMSTSPVALLRVITDLRAGGQVTERALHLTAVNCMLAVFVFKAIVAYSIVESAGGIPRALWNGLVVVLLSVGIGSLFGWLLPLLLRRLGQLTSNSMVALVIAVLLLTALMHSLKFSPLIAALVFGLMVRSRRVILPQRQQHFGVIGDLLTVLLFVFVAATLHWRQVVSGLGIALVIIVVRFVVKTLVTTAFAYKSGISWRKGFFTGVAMTPLSIFAILLFEQTRMLIPEISLQVAGLSAITLLLEVLGPLAAHFAFVWAGETSVGKER